MQRVGPMKTVTITEQRKEGNEFLDAMRKKDERVYGKLRTVGPTTPGGKATLERDPAGGALQGGTLDADEAAMYEAMAKDVGGPKVSAKQKH